MEKWHSLDNIGPRPYKCGYCGAMSGSRSGYFRNHYNWRIYICSNCARPTFFEGEQQNPASLVGSPVSHIPEEIEILYNEIRKCTSFGAYNCAVLVGRKLLMNIAVKQGAEQGKTFLEYIDYLASKGYIPPNGKEWVDYIRNKGSEADYEVVLMVREDASEIITFIEMLLKFIYEFPSRMRK